MPVKHKPPATCHPDKPHFGRGLCSACYFKERRERTPAREALRADQRLAVPLSAILESPRDFPHAVQLASAELTAALPEAARALRRILASGDLDREVVLKAAVAILRGVPVPGGKAGLKRLLEAPSKPTEGSGPTQVVVGLHIAAGDVQGGRVVGTIGPPREP